MKASVFILLIAIYANLFAQDSTDYTAIYQQAISNYQLRNYDKALEQFTEVLFSYDIVGIKDIDMSELYRNLARTCSERGSSLDLEKALEYQNEALSRMQLKSQEYEAAMHDLVYYNAQASRAEMNGLVDKALDMSEALYKEDKLSMARHIYPMMERLERIGAFSIAKSYSMKYLSYMEHYPDSDVIQQIDELNLLAANCNNERNNDDELYYLLKAEPLIGKLYSQTSYEYIGCLYHIADIYNHRMSSALAGRDVAAYRKDSLNYEKWHEPLRAALVNLGLYETIESTSSGYYLQTSKNYSDKKNYVQALKQAELALNISSAIDDEPNIALSYSVMADIYYTEGDSDNALKYCRKTVELYDKIGVESVYYASSLNQLSVSSFVCGRVEEAYTLGKRSMTMYQNMIGKAGDSSLNDSYSKVLKNLLNYCNKLGKTDEAKTCQNILGSLGSSTEFTTYLEWANNAFEERNETEFASNIHQAYSLVREDIVKAAQGSSIRSDSFKQHWINAQYVNDLLFLGAYQFPDNRIIVTDAYNALLMKRGIEQNNGLNTATVDDVSKLLKEKECAIEVFTFKTSNGGLAYNALLLRNDMSVLKCIKLFSEAELRKIEFQGTDDFFTLMNTEEGKSMILDSPYVSLYVWSNIIPELDGIETVYFTQEGLFKTVNLEDAIIEDEATGGEIRLSRKYKFNLVNQTSDIIAR